MSEATPKQMFLELYNSVKSLANRVDYIVLAIQLPSGAVEISTNISELDAKVEYIDEIYDDELCLKSNQDVTIIDFMII